MIDSKGRELQENFSYCYEDKINMENDKERKIFLSYGIDSTITDGEGYDCVIRKIFRYNKEDIGVPIEDRKPIFIYINSPGGYVSDGFGLIDAISLSVTPIYTVNLAKVQSMAFLIFISGHKRFAMPHSQFLLHDGSVDVYDSTAKARDRFEFEIIEMEKQTKEHVLKHTNINAELFEEKYRCEWYFLSKKAKEMGIVDFIVGEDCDIEKIL